jgi:hypothetical protein
MVFYFLWNSNEDFSLQTETSSYLRVHLLGKYVVECVVCFIDCKSLMSYWNASPFVWKSKVVVALRWDTPQPNSRCEPDSLDNSNIEKLSALNQQQSKIPLVLVVAVPYVRFTTPMTFCVLSTLIKTSKNNYKNFSQSALPWPILPWWSLVLSRSGYFSAP